MKIDLQRTLRVPDNGDIHNLPPRLGNFSLHHIEDLDLDSNNHLMKRGGVIMPMFQADALWVKLESINVTGEEDYPIAVKIGTGKICAVSGENWTTNLNRDPQDYVVVPDQPWIDGYNIGKDTVRQFVAAPLGQGYTVEEQLKSEPTIGGIQIQVFPIKRDSYHLLNAPASFYAEECKMLSMMSCAEPFQEIGLAAGRSMRQAIYEDPHKFDA